MLEGDMEESTADPGALRGLKTPLGHGVGSRRGILDQPFVHGKYYVKDNVYRPTSELVSL